jgi:hypothetical protein
MGDVGIGDELNERRAVEGDAVEELDCVKQALEVAGLVEILSGTEAVRMQRPQLVDTGPVLACPHATTILRCAVVDGGVPDLDVDAVERGADRRQR